MENILYLDDYINLYNEKLQKIITYKPYKNTLKFGHIIDSEKFSKNMSMLIKANNLSNNIFNSEISIVINPTYSKLEKQVIKNILEDLNYKNIKFIQELDYLKLSKDNLIINYNYEYMHWYYIDKLGKVKMILLENNEINCYLIKTILKKLNKKEIYLFGKNIQEIENILKEEPWHYYYFEDSENLIINKILS